MINEYYIFLSAVQYFSRIPVRLARFEADYIRKALTYLPVVGFILSVIQCAFAILFFSAFSGLIAACLVVATGILLTGAFHEDGFADTIDAFGGAFEKTRIL